MTAAPSLSTGSTNTCGFHVEAYTHEVGWKPCTHPVATREEADELLAKFDRKAHRVYTAIIGYTLADQKA